MCGTNRTNERGSAFVGYSLISSLISLAIVGSMGYVANTRAESVKQVTTPYRGYDDKGKKRAEKGTPKKVHWENDLFLEFASSLPKPMRSVQKSTSAGTGSGETGSDELTFQDPNALSMVDALSNVPDAKSLIGAWYSNDSSYSNERSRTVIFITNKSSQSQVVGVTFRSREGVPHGTTTKTVGAGHQWVIADNYDKGYVMKQTYGYFEINSTDTTHLVCQAYVAKFHEGLSPSYVPIDIR